MSTIAPPASGQAPDIVEVTPPPRSQLAGEWARRNLFRGPFDTVVTIVASMVVGYVLYRLFMFVFVTGRWDVARANLTLFLVGPYDRDELWRPVLALVTVAAYGGLWVGFLRRGGLTPVPATATKTVAVPNPADPLAAADLAGEPAHTDLGRAPTRMVGTAEDTDEGPEPAQPLWRRALGILGRLWPLLLGVALLLSLARTVTPWFVAIGVVAAAAVGYLAGRVLPLVVLRAIGAAGSLGALGYFLYLDPFDWLPGAFPGPRSVGQLAQLLIMITAGVTVCVLVGLGLAALVRRVLHVSDAHRAAVAAMVFGLVAALAFLAADPLDVIPDLPRVSLINVWLGMLGVLVVAAVAIGLSLVKNPAGGLIGLGVFGSMAMLLVLTDAVGWDDWGGMMLNIFLAVISITLCFPLGVLLALGRRSQMPLIRGVCTSYIELFRGVPLYVLLVMAGVPLTLFIPRSVTPGLVARAIIVFTLFTAAYVAEIVRGGLQSLPRGQTEAGQALGLSGTRVILLIVLPQALRNVIPAMVGQFISLFKDTTLAGGALSFIDLLAAAQVASRQGDFRGQALLGETVSFVMLLFWIGSITMSRESQRLERKLGVGTR